MTPALAGGFFTTAAAAKSIPQYKIKRCFFFWKHDAKPVEGVVEGSDRIWLLIIQLGAVVQRGWCRGGGRGCGLIQNWNVGQDGAAEGDGIYGTQGAAWPLLFVSTYLLTSQSPSPTSIALSPSAPINKVTKAARGHEGCSPWSRDGPAHLPTPPSLLELGVPGNH